MKQLYFFILILISIATVFAQSPALINYQAVVRDANGNLITSGTISLGISIHDAITGGNQLYFETHNGITSNAFGVVNVLIGGGTVIAGNFLLINWGNGNKYLQVYVNSNPIGSRTQMVSVPYALYANKADSSNYATAALTATTATTAINVQNVPMVTTGWQDYLIVSEQRAYATGVPLASGATYTKRALNTIQSIKGNAISFDAVNNTITLFDTGYYYIRASAPAWQSDEHQLVIRNVNNSAILLTGTSEHSVDNGNSPEPTHSFVDGVLHITSQTVFKLDHFFNVTADMGRGSPPLSGNLPTVLAKCFVQKIQ